VAIGYILRWHDELLQVPEDATPKLIAGQVLSAGTRNRDHGNCGNRVTPRVQSMAPRRSARRRSERRAALQSALSRPASLAFNSSARQLLAPNSGLTGAIRQIDLNTNLISLLVPYGQAVPSAPIALDRQLLPYYVAPVDSSGARKSCG